MLEWMLMPLRRYAEFSGRSRRKEYWSFFLLNMVVIIALLVLRSVVGGGESMMDAARGGGSVLAIYGSLLSGVGILLGVWWLATLIPNIAVNIRRLHDRDMSGWWYLGFIVGSMIPLLNILVSIGFLVIMCLEGTQGTNRFGADPKGGSTSSDVFA